MTASGTHPSYPIAGKEVCIVLAVREFRIPSLILTGLGASQQVGEQCKKRGLQKALIVTGRRIRSSGIVAQIEQALAQSGISYSIYDGVATEPVIEFVEAGLEMYRTDGCDFVLAVGGGSPIDTAKAIAVMTTNEGSISDYKGIGKIPQKGAPLVALPTTAGTGSEVTIYTIITDAATNVKMLIGSPFLMPDVAIVDPILTVSSPPGVTAATGIDALVHAIEAYVSVKAQPMSDIFALSAIELISGNLRQAWANGDNLDAREKTMLGALQAGIAFSNSSVALVHGMSRPIGAYFHLAHGVSNAALLAVCMEFSLIGNPRRYADIAGAMGENIAGLTDLSAADLAVQAVRRLVSDVNIPPLHELIEDEEEFYRLAPQMAEDAIDSGSPANNPRQATKEQIIRLYKSETGEKGLVDRC